MEGKADRTLVLYGQSITYFSRFLAERDLDADVSNLTHGNVLAWLDSLRERGPANFADAVSDAQGNFASGEGFFNMAAMAFSAADYADAAYDSAYGSILAFDLGPQDLLIGGLEALGF